MAHFQPGDRVRVLSTHMATHHRTPDYVKGRVGRVHALSGHYPNPETSAYGGDGLPERDLYLVEFGMERDLGRARPLGLAGDTAAR